MPANLSSDCTCFHLRRAARMVSQVYDQELAAVDLSLNEYSILRHASRGPCLLGELADALGMERTTLTRNLRPLIDAGWVKAGNFSRNQDKFSYAYLLTPSGIEAKARLTRAFLARKLGEYDRLRAEIEGLQAEVGDGR